MADGSSGSESSRSWLVVAERIIAHSWNREYWLSSRPSTRTICVRGKERDTGSRESMNGLVYSVVHCNIITAKREIMKGLEKEVGYVNITRLFYT